MVKEKIVKIKDYGEVVLKKLSWREKSGLKGKAIRMTVDQLGNAQNPELDLEGLSMWLLVYSIKSLPSYKEFYKFNDDNKKYEIVGNLGLGEGEPDDLGDQIFAAANEFNNLNPSELKKK